ncbi:MAG: phage shock protein PspA [Clostridiaceae bacterium]|nr:phage shock protein PspA [Clostridiaceae bacterium]
MGILNRIKSILSAKANVVLNEMENSEETLELSVVEMRQKITEIKKVSELENKKEELIAVNKAADAQLVVKEIMIWVSSDITDITDRIERAENKIAERSARISTMDELVEMGELDGMGKTDKIDKELKAISEYEE